MPVELTLHKAAEELHRGDLASVLRARQRVAGLVGTYPQRLDLRERLAEVYRVLGQPAQAGRWTYLSDERDPDELLAFERAYRRADSRLVALSWQGRVDEAPTETARTRLASLYQEARVQLQQDLDDTPNEETSWGACLIVMAGGTFVLVCFLLGIVTLVQFLWKLVS
ncbi:hypothetical protein SAMN04488074_111116 [Lentzea albidocapillata subsp. violacea]|uniref:Uncharacterized protein n=1 Tax=Lentzea albidocapillata subsp. violacea TaxID=128104 RepID=A0A1G9KDW3_9PSEU|nr:DUF6584 family protein [Lentzea albidocapillata]SDL47907.1 hypothetical protein SAMN04488074_111116 [Lentzea albidocapillata subsp. violacea]